MKKKVRAVLAVLLMPIRLCADQADPVERKNDNLYQKSPFIQYHNRVNLFAPFYQGYERTEPDAFYIGVEAFLASIVNKGHDSALLDGEIRMGYNFFFKEEII